MKTTEYRIRFILDKPDLHVYLGTHLVGTVVKTVDHPMHRKPHYAGHIHLPGMYGPVVREDTLYEARSAITEKIEEWVSGMGEGQDTPEATKPRITRTRG